MTSESNELFINSGQTLSPYSTASSGFLLQLGVTNSIDVWQRKQKGMAEKADRIGSVNNRIMYLTTRITQASDLSSWPSDSDITVLKVN